MKKTRMSLMALSAISAALACSAAATERSSNVFEFKKTDMDEGAGVAKTNLSIDAGYPQIVGGGSVVQPAVPAGIDYTKKLDIGGGCSDAPFAQTADGHAKLAHGGGMGK